MTEEKRQHAHRLSVGLIAVTVFACISLTALTLALVYRFNTSNELRQQTITNCKELERIKTIIRIDKQTANQDVYRAYPPAARKAEHQRLERTIRALAPIDCNS